jgi:hypothetical protein
MFLLLGGTGVSSDITAQLPAITKPGKKRTLMKDSIMGGPLKF